MAYRHNEHEILETMTQYGGNFIRHLVRLYQAADRENQKILEQAFRHYFEQYDNMIDLVNAATKKG